MRGTNGIHESNDPLGFGHRWEGLLYPGVSVFCVSVFLYNVGNLDSGIIMGRKGWDFWTTGQTGKTMDGVMDGKIKDTEQRGHGLFSFDIS